MEIQIWARYRSRSKSRFQISHAFSYYRQVYSNIAPPPFSPHKHPFLLYLSLSMTSWRGMWEIWYNMLRQQCTAVHFLTLYTLIFC